MKKLVLTLSLVAILFVPLLSSAQTPVTVTTSVTVTSVQGFADLLGKVLNGLKIIFFALAAIFVFMAAFRYLTAQGDATKLGEAKNMLIYTAIALAVAILANSVKPLVLSILK